MCAWLCRGASLESAWPKAAHDTSYSSLWYYVPDGTKIHKQDTEKFIKKMLCRDGMVSLVCFIVAGLIPLLPKILSTLGLYLVEFIWFIFIYIIYIHIYSSYFISFLLLHAVQYIVINIFAFLAFSDFSYQVAVRALFLGYVFGIGILVAIIAPVSWQIFGIYMTVLATFHYSEFLAIAWANPATLSIDCFILNHSIIYSIAASVSWLEFFIERYYFHNMKLLSFISYFGLMLCISGEVLRKLAICTAKHNFNYNVQNEKSDDHELITHGIYGLCRHPSYVGWFYWSIGTQLILQNPLSFIAYAWISWNFFHERVRMEEITLYDFFGQDYAEYQKKVGTGLPFISGHKVNLQHPTLV